MDQEKFHLTNSLLSLITAETSIRYLCSLLTERINGNKCLRGREDREGFGLESGWEMRNGDRYFGFNHHPPRKACNILGIDLRVGRDILDTIESDVEVSTVREKPSASVSSSQQRQRQDVRFSWTDLEGDSTVTARTSMAEQSQFHLLNYLAVLENLSREFSGLARVVASRMNVRIGVVRRIMIERGFLPAAI